MRKRGRGHRLLIAAIATASGASAEIPLDKAAALFGARPSVEQISLSPDGDKVAIIAPTTGPGNAVLVAPIQGEAKPIATSSGVPMKLTSCGWSASDRLVCRQRGDLEGISFSRMFGMDSDGKRQLPLARRSSGDTTRISQHDGRVIDWMAGKDGSVLMERDFVPEITTGSHIRSDRGGLGVELVNTRTLQTARVEQPRTNAAGYIADGRGDVRIMWINQNNAAGMLTGTTDYFYRDPDGKGQWRKLTSDDVSRTGWQPIAVDAGLNVAYALHRLNGRLALYRMSLDGKATTALVYANPQVDVDDVIQVGRSARVIGASYVTDRRQTIFFDDAYAKLSRSLAKAVPGLPLISFVGASADENRLLLRAGSDVNPGGYYVLDRAARAMNPILLERPGLEGETLAPVRAVSFPAGDGTMVPAYLTLPVGATAKGLPAIVMPHGGPAARDEWGFDWLAQFFAARGYAVLQPNFRGSTGYGDQWFVDNGFRSWKVAIGDVTDAGRWLVREGTADPARLAIVG